MRSSITRRQFLLASAAVAASAAGCSCGGNVVKTNPHAQAPSIHGGHNTTLQRERAAIFARVKKIIVSTLGVDAGKVVPQASIIGDLGADSLDVTELIMAIEEEFGFEIPDQEAEKLVTVRDIVDYLLQRTTRANARTLPPRQPVCVRDATLSDLDQMTLVTLASWRATHAPILGPEHLSLGTRSRFEARWTELLRDGGPHTSCLAVVSNGRVVAVGASGPCRLDRGLEDEPPCRILRESRCGELFRGYVQLSLSMRNHAERLFHSCTTRLREQGFDRAVLWTNSANVHMRRFAESMGGSYITRRTAIILGRVAANQQEVLYSFDLNKPVAQPRGRLPLAGKGRQPGVAS